MDYDFNRSHAWKSDPDDLFMDNVYAFRDIVNLYSHGIDFYFPNYRDAPWQVQAEISGEKVNFWPHKMKAHVEYTKGGAVEGRYAIIDLINEQIAKDPDSSSGKSDDWTLADDWDDDEFDLFE
jgi:hypothetical protein